MVVCQHVGFRSRKVRWRSPKRWRDPFILPGKTGHDRSGEVKRGGPAYAIIRQAIRKRSYYNEQVKAFECSLYSKDMLKLRNLPKKILGRKISEQDRSDMGVDSAGKGIIYLSESVSRVYSQLPDKLRPEVISSRVSGSDGSVYLSHLHQFHQNNVRVPEPAQSRGFVSPIADNALSIYKYKFLGSFFEDGKEINSIQGGYRRLYEPAFSGIINITEGDWRIHSRTWSWQNIAARDRGYIEIDQIHVPVGGDVWKKTSWSISAFKQFGIDAIGNFVTVYSNYLINPTFAKTGSITWLSGTIRRVNKRSKEYWDTIRPVPLEVEERMDYEVKDSLFEMRKDSLLSQSSIDSLKRNRVNSNRWISSEAGIPANALQQNEHLQLGIESLIRAWIQYGGGHWWWISTCTSTGISRSGKPMYPLSRKVSMAFQQHASQCLGYPAVPHPRLGNG